METDKNVTTFTDLATNSNTNRSGDGIPDVTCVSGERYDKLVEYNGDRYQNIDGAYNDVYETTQGDDFK